MVILSPKNIGKGIWYTAKAAVYTAVVGVLTAGVIEQYTTTRIPLDKPKNVYEAKLRDNEKSDLVVRLESGKNDIMLRGENGLESLKNKKGKELNELKAKYDSKRQEKVSEYDNLKGRLATPEVSEEPEEPEEFEE